MVLSTHWNQRHQMDQNPNRVELISLQITGEDEGRMVKEVLQNRLHLSRRLIRRLIEAQSIYLNNETVYVTRRVQAGDHLRLLHVQEDYSFIIAQPMELDIRYEDDFLLVVNKPAGIIVHPTSGHYTGTLANGIMHYYEQTGQVVRFRPVHRIDQDTSGVIVIAKNQFAHQQLDRSLRSRHLLREYDAFVHGTPATPSGVVDAPISRNPDNPHQRGVFFEEKGQHAVTHFRTIQTYPEYTWVRVQLETGRTHQIRVHMSYIGHPLLGDELYGGSREWIHRQALHARLLGIEHPQTKEWMQWEVELPTDLQQLAEGRGEP